VGRLYKISRVRALKPGALNGVWERRRKQRQRPPFSAVLPQARSYLMGSGPGWADEVGSDAIPDTAGGEGGHGAAKSDRVIHRYIFFAPKNLCRRYMFANK
jgi:hypothetical protein